MKHLFLALGLMAAIACRENVKKKGLVSVDPPSKDTVKTVVRISTAERNFNAKVFYQPRLIDTTEPANADSSLLRPIKMRVYDKQIFLHVVDSVVMPNKSKRAIDTFVQVDNKFVLEDLKKSWK